MTIRTTYGFLERLYLSYGECKQTHQQPNICGINQMQRPSKNIVAVTHPHDLFLMEVYNLKFAIIKVAITATHHQAPSLFLDRLNQ